MTFDPYHKWLGIPASEQPANHYRLLAITLFEDDPDVIETAADQRMGLLRTFHAGPHSALSQRLLNELASAKLALLNVEEKAGYDAKLRERLAASPSAHPAVTVVAASPATMLAPPRPVAAQPPMPALAHQMAPQAPVREAAPIIVTDHGAAPYRPSARQKKHSRGAFAWLALAALGAAATSFTVWLLWTKAEPKAAPPQPDVLAADGPAAEPAEPPTPTKEPNPGGGEPIAADGWRPLFNGQDLTGWKTHPDKPGNWRVEDGILKGAGPATSYLITERGDFTNFHLRVEARINAGGDSGVYCRASLGPEFWPDGYEAQIDASEQGEMTGGLYGRRQAGPLIRVADSPVGAGEWFTMETIAVENRIVVKVNGRTTADYSDESAGRFLVGHIALEKYREQTEVEFRKIEIRENPPAGNEDLVEAPGGNAAEVKRFAFEIPDPRRAKWSIQGDELVQSSPKDNARVLFGQADWRDFDFLVEVQRIEPNDGCGMLLRYENDQNVCGVGFGGWRNTAHNASASQGGRAEDLAYAKGSFSTGEWHRLEVRTRGTNYKCFLDGAQVMTFDLKQQPRGRLGLYAHGAYRFRHIQVKSPDGQVLLEGLPDLDGHSAAPEIATVDKDDSKLRFPSEIRGGKGDDWSIEGDELVCRPDHPSTTILFGEPSWTDYEFSFDAKEQKGWFGRFFFRYQDENNFHSYGIRAGDNSYEVVDTMEGGTLGKRQCERHVAIPYETWQQIRIRVRGEKGTCFRNGKIVGEFSMPHLSKGRVGFVTEKKASYRFRNIVVKSSAGKVLLKGLPAGIRTRAPGDLIKDDNANAAELTAKEAFALKRHEAAVTRLAFHRTLPLLASAGKDGRVLLWNLQTRALPVELHKFGEEVWAVKFHPSGDYLAFANRNWWGSRLFFKTFIGQKLNEIKDFKNPGGEVMTIAYSHDGRLLAAGQVNGTIRLWDVAQFREIPPVAFGDGHNINALAFGTATVDRKNKLTHYLLAAGGQDGLVRTLTATINNKTGQWTFLQTKADFPRGGPVISVRFNTDGSFLGATRLGGAVGLFDPNTGESVRELMPGVRINPTEWIAFHPQRPWCVTAHKNEQVARIWDTETAELLCELKGHTGGVMCAEFSPDGRHVATASEDLSIKLWNLAGPDVPTGADRRKKPKSSVPIVGD